MSAQSILLLVSIALLLGFLSRRWQRVNTLLVASILLMYWLQPETSLRYQGFWLPTLSLGLIVLSWAATADAATRKQPGTLSTIWITIAALGLLNAVDLLSPGQQFGFNRFPPLGSQLLGLLGCLGIAALLIIRKGGGTGLSWVFFVLLICFFVLLKTPALTLRASQLWRAIAGQSPGLATASEFQWMGYSYIAFRLLHTLRDRQTGRLPATALNEYIAYVVFFPALLAGPIARVNQVLDDLRSPSRPFSLDLISGSQRLILGLFKKFVLADSLAIFALNPASADLVGSTPGHWLILYAYSFQIFFDFSGYTDIAIGLGNLLGVQLPENFNRPYLKPNLTQFWNNWHMTLTNWFRAYFFNPISRVMRRKKLPAFLTLLVTQVATMLLVGLWHGITINFAIWGLWHGLGLLIQNRWSAFIKRYLPPPDRHPLIGKALAAFGALLTFHFVTLGWIWFVLPDPGSAWRFLLSLFRPIL